MEIQNLCLVCTKAWWQLNGIMLRAQAPPFYLSYRPSTVHVKTSHLLRRTRYNIVVEVPQRWCSWQQIVPSLLSN